MSSLPPSTFIYVYLTLSLSLLLAVKPIKEEERNKQLENGNKCTNEYHNQPKMALAKSSSAGKKSRKASRQPPEDAVILVVSAAGEAAETGAGVGAGAGVVAAGRGTEECVMPKGNEQSAQIRNNVNEAGLQRVEEQLQPEQKMKEDREPELEQEQEQKEHNNMLVKPKLKLSKKSWQITGRDQDELRCDEVANINNGQQRSLQWQGLGEEGQVGLQESQHCSHPQQYQNYHCSTGKSASSSSSSRRSSNSSGDEAKLSQSTSANKLSTVKRATAAAGATAAEIALVVATATATPAPAAVAVAVAANSAGESSVRPGRGHQ